MASLRSIILDGRFLLYLSDYNNPENLSQRRIDTEKTTCLHTLTKLQERDTILVNAQKVFEDVYRVVEDTPEAATAQIAEPQQIPRPKPPYHQMWIEALQHYRDGKQRRVGILVQRAPASVLSTIPDWQPCVEPEQSRIIRETLARDQPSELVFAFVWYELNGSACCQGKITYWLDAGGNFQYSFRNLNHIPQNREHMTVALRAQQLWLLHTMARLNCHNVELIPMATGQAKANKKTARPHSSVWHEIVVKPSPAAKRSRAENPGEAEKHAVRLHKVRGHYADYRQGAGLFGKWKVLIWVDEHEVGNAELGTVVASYKVE